MPKKKESTSVAARLRNLKHAEPFKPFRVATARGGTITVAAADDFIVSPGGKSGFFNPQETDDMRFLHLRDVLSIDLPRNSRRRPDRRSNGRGKR